MRAALALLCATAIGCGPAPSPVRHAASGFDPARDGFGFANYGNPTGVANLGPDELYALFGPAACARLDGDRCTPTAAATEWAEARNAEMVYGHCEGMAALALLRFTGELGYGDGPLAALPFDDPALQRLIARLFVMQLLEPTVSSEVRPPSVRALLDAIAAAPSAYLLGVYPRDGGGGHTLVPFAVDAAGDGSARISVYDPNAPGETRAVTVDERAGVWSYEVAALGRTPARLLEGDDATRTMGILPRGVRLEPQRCPFCP